MNKHLAPILLLPLLGGLTEAADPSDYVAFIRQHQQQTGVIWDMPVDLVGEGLSAMAVEEGGSLFQLWAIQRSTFRDYLIDQELVGAWLPKGSIKVTTDDPYPVPRTRADQPFEVNVKVDGLLSGDDLPDSSKKVVLEHYTAHYPEYPDEPVLSQRQALAGGPIDSIYIDKNGDTKLDFPATSLTGPDPTKVMGEEHFVLHALPDTNVTQTQIAGAMVQIWPVADGRITGIENGDEVHTSPPDLTIYLNDLYPRSDTYVQVYPGGPKDNKHGEKLPGSVLVLDQDKSEDRVLTVKDWGSVITKDGPHTMELLTETPFGTDRLQVVSFTTQRVLRVRATLGDLTDSAAGAP